ncbi:kinase-like domain-containing protein, partial [Piptocephalis cylindrospora]
FYRHKALFDAEVNNLRRIKKANGGEHRAIVSFKNYMTAEDETRTGGWDTVVYEPGESTLFEYSRQRRPLPSDEVQEIIKDVASGLVVIKKAGLIHDHAHGTRVWKITGFEMAREPEGKFRKLETRTMPPELAIIAARGGERGGSYPVDVYSLGRMIYWLVDNGSLWRSIDLGSDTQLSWLMDATKEFPVSSKIQPKDLRLLITDMIKKRADDRPTIEEVTERAGRGKWKGVSASKVKRAKSPIPRPSPSICRMNDDEFDAIVNESAPDLMVDDYQMDQECFRGGMSLIRPATHILTNTNVVLKFYRDKRAFSREQEALKEIKHVNIISLLDYFEPEELDPPNPQPIMVLERGQVTLRQYYEENTSRDIIKAKGIFKTMLSAIKVVHEAQFVHCDIKPENFMLFGSSATREGTWKLIDFDSACKIGEEVLRGTVAFCAPEVIGASVRGEKVDATPSMDVFSLGQLLYWMTHVEPIWGNCITEEQMTSRLLDTEALILSVQHAQNRPTTNYVRRLLSKDPSFRPTLREMTCTLILYEEESFKDPIHHKEMLQWRKRVPFMWAYFHKETETRSDMHGDDDDNDDNGNDEALLWAGSINCITPDLKNKEQFPTFVMSWRLLGLFFIWHRVTRWEFCS